MAENVIRPNQNIEYTHTKNVNSYYRLSNRSSQDGMHDKYGEMRLRLAVVENHEFRRDPSVEINPVDTRYIINTNTGRLAIKWVDMPGGVLRPTTLVGSWEYKRENDKYNPEIRDYNDYSIKSRREMVELTHPFIWTGLDHNSYCGFNYLPPVGSLMVIGFRKNGFPIVLGFLSTNFRNCYPTLKPGEMVMKGYGDNYTHWRWSDKLDMNVKSREEKCDLDDPDIKENITGLPIKKNLANSELWLRLNANDRHIEMIATQTDTTSHENGDDPLIQQLKKHGYINKETGEIYDKYITDKVQIMKDVLNGKWLKFNNESDRNEAIERLNNLGGSHGTHTTKLILQPRSLFIESEEILKKNFNEEKENGKYYDDDKKKENEHHHERLRITKYYQNEQRIHTYAHKFTPSIYDKEKIEWTMIRDQEASLITTKSIKKYSDSSKKLEINTLYGSGDENKNSSNLKNEEINVPERELYIDHDITFINEDGMLEKRTHTHQDCFNIDQDAWQNTPSEIINYETHKHQDPTTLKQNSIEYSPPGTKRWESIRKQIAKDINQTVKDYDDNGDELITTINQTPDKIDHEASNETSGEKTKRTQNPQSIKQRAINPDKESIVKQTPTSFEVDVPGDFVVKSTAAKINLEKPKDDAIGTVDIGNSTKVTNIAGKTVNITASPHVNIGSKVHLAGGGPGIARIGDSVVVSGPHGNYSGTITGGSSNSDSS